MFALKYKNLYYVSKFQSILFKKTDVFLRERDFLMFYQILSILSRLSLCIY